MEMRARGEIARPSRTRGSKTRRGLKKKKARIRGTRPSESKADWLVMSNQSSRALLNGFSNSMGIQTCFNS